MDDACKLAVMLGNRSETTVQKQNRMAQTKFSLHLKL